MLGLVSPKTLRSQKKSTALWNDTLSTDRNPDETASTAAKKILMAVDSSLKKTACTQVCRAINIQFKNLFTLYTGALLAKYTLTIINIYELKCLHSLSFLNYWPKIFQNNTHPHFTLCLHLLQCIHISFNTLQIH